MADTRHPIRGASDQPRERDRNSPTERPIPLPWDLLDPTNDYVFKVLFKDPDAERRLISMLTAVLDPKVPITSARVLDSEILPDLESGKAIVLDVRVELADRTTIGVEMETMPRRAFPPRLLFYWSRNHSQQLVRGEDYSRLRPTIGIAWTGGLLPVLSKVSDAPIRMHSRFRVRNVETHVDLTDQLELHVLELPKLAADDTLSPSLRRWARFFAHPSEAELAALAAEDEIMAETVNKLREISADERHRHQAESRLRNEFAYHAELAAEREEGIAIGKEEGIALGEAKVARAMLRGGADRASVAQALGIAEQELDAYLARYGA